MFVFSCVCARKMRVHKYTHTYTHNNTVFFFIFYLHLHCCRVKYEITFIRALICVKVLKDNIFLANATYKFRRYYICENCVVIQNLSIYHRARNIKGILL